MKWTRDPSEIADAEVIEDALEVAEPEALRPMPAVAEVRTIQRASPTLPAVQAAAAAATGFVAGAATLALVRRHGSRRRARAALHRRPGIDGLAIVGSRSFLIDVHLIAKPGE